MTEYLAVLKRVFTFRKNNIFILVGFSIGFAAFLFTFQYVLFELRYDRFYSNFPHVYRLRFDKYENGQHIKKGVGTPDALAVQAKNEVPEIKEIVRIGFEETLVVHEEEKYTNQKTFWVDPNFFTLFNIPILYGDTISPLNEPNTIAISRSKSEAFFKSENPIGKTIYINENLPFLITAVFEDIPINSHIKYDFLLSFPTIVNYNWGSEQGEWIYEWVHTYVLLRPDANIAQVEQKLQSIADHNMGFLKEKNQKMKFTLQPVTKLHFEQNLIGETEPKIDKKNIVGLIILSIIILLFTLINFVNLSTASVIKSSSSLITKKCLGSGNLRLTILANLEFLTLMILGCGVSFLLLFIFDDIVSGWFNISFYDIVKPDHKMIFNVIVILIICMSILGFSIFFIIRAISPANNMNSKTVATKNIGQFKKLQIAAQLLLTLFLFGCTFIYGKQIRFMNNQDIGMELDKTFAIKLPQSLHGDITRKSKVISFKEAIKNNKFIKEASISLVVPGLAPQLNADGIRMIKAPDYPKLNWDVLVVSSEYTNVYDMQLLSGRMFDEFKESDANSVILNVKGAIALVGKNYDEIIGETVELSGKQYNVIGVINDFHHLKLNKEIKPVILRLGTPELFGYLSIKLKTKQTQEAINQINEIWTDRFPNDAFFWFSVDSNYKDQYINEHRINKLISLITLITFLIGTIGLFAFSISVVQTKIKNTGIRKIMGANVFQLYYYLSRDFLAILTLVGIIAAPFIYYSMTGILSNFANRIDLTIIDIFIPYLLFVILTILIFSSKIIEAVFVNPVELIRNE